MAIHLVTGIPGHGKTLYMVGRLMDELIDECEAAGRKVYHNIAEFDPKRPHVHAVTDDHVLTWADENGPRNAIFVIDEAQFLFPVRNPAARVPEHVEKLSTHRHRGLDFYLITQHGSLLDRFVIPLIESHTDVYRPYGLQVSRVTKFPYYAPQVKHRATLQMGETKRLRFKKEHFGSYRSATMHTYQPGLPWKKIGMLGGAISIAVGGAIFGVWSMFAASDPDARLIGSASAAQEVCPPPAIAAIGAGTFPTGAIHLTRNIPGSAVDCR
jgi:zona occludens toxin